MFTKTILNTTVSLTLDKSYKLPYIITIQNQSKTIKLHYKTFKTADRKYDKALNELNDVLLKYKFLIQSQNSTPSKNIKFETVEEFYARTNPMPEISSVESNVIDINIHKNKTKISA